MTTQEQQNLGMLEESLFLNKERMLRWMRVIQGKRSLHPELEAYERQLNMPSKRSLLSKLIRLLICYKLKL